MARRRWTVVLVPHGSEPSKIIEVSYGVVKAIGFGLVLAAVAVLLVGYAALSRGTHPARATRLARENALLSRELGDLHGRLSLLNDTLARISQRDAHIRVLADLDPIDPQVQAAGIGGPTSPGGPARLGALDSAGATARRAEDIRIDLDALIRRADLLAVSFQEAADSLADHSERLAATPSIMPTQGWLSSAFSAMRAHPILHLARPHEGIDVSAPRGSPIEAPAAGIVTGAGPVPGYGNTVTLDHGYGIVTMFAHASKILVHVGQRVERGQRIALVGNSGLATGPHLHYEVHVNGRPVDPLRYVLPDNVVAD